MMRRRFSLLIALTLLAGCAVSDSTAPTRQAGRAASLDFRGWGGPTPGTVGNASTSNGQGNRLPCNVPSELNGSATIGPEGGILDVGPHRLIIPPGALDTKVFVSGTVPAGTTIEIHLEPHGLRFRKPAGLILNASSCADAPDIVYLDEVGVVAERIKAIFSNWWHVVAAPIDHFSVYALEV